MTERSSSASPSSVPRSIEEYLRQLRQALEGADAAMIQDALRDAEEHLRAECAARPGEAEESVLQVIADSYGAPVDVAAAYRETDRTVQAAIAPRPRSAAVASPRTGAWLRRFLAVYGDVRSWTSLMFMLLSLVTGILYFTVVVTGVTLSLSLSILIIGVPVFVAFIGLTRVLALAEGRLVEAMTGERMPRRAQPPAGGGWIARIGAMLRSPRTWSTLIYQLLMLPLGVLYFTLAMALVAVGLALLGGGCWELLRTLGVDLPPAMTLPSGPVDLEGVAAPLFALVLLFAGGLLLTATMHLARGIGRFHGRLAKRLLVAI